MKNPKQKDELSKQKDESLGQNLTRLKVGKIYLWRRRSGGPAAFLICELPDMSNNNMYLLYSYRAGRNKLLRAHASDVERNMLNPGHWREL